MLFSVHDISMWFDRVRLIGKLSLERNRGLQVVGVNLEVRIFDMLFECIPVGKV